MWSAFLTSPARLVVLMCSQVSQWPVLEQPIGEVISVVAARGEGEDRGSGALGQVGGDPIPWRVGLPSRSVSW
jgi:hypothetical protein